MSVTATRVAYRQELESAIHRVEARFAPQVVRIRYSFGEDWTGHPSIFFRILLTDEAAHIEVLGELGMKISIALMNEAETDENGFSSYFNFSSESEQEKSQDPDWV